MAEQTWREMIIDLENAYKRKANLENWSQQRRMKIQGHLDNIKAIFVRNGIYDRSPSRKDQDIASQVTSLPKKWGRSA